MITLNVGRADNLLQKSIGLIGKKRPRALLLKTRFGIHTLGLKFPIDVVIVDKNNRVVVLKQYLKPNNFFLWNPTYNKVIELPEGTIKKKHIKMQSKIRLNVTE